MVRRGLLRLCGISRGPTPGSRGSPALLQWPWRCPCWGCSGWTRRREPGALRWCVRVVGSQVPAVTTAAGGDRGSCLAAVAPVLNRASFAAARVLLPDTHSALVPGEEEYGGCAGESPLWVSSCQLLSGTEGFIPFLCFIWKEPLSLWLLLLPVAGVFVGIRPLSPALLEQLPACDPPSSVWLDLCVSVGLACPGLLVMICGCIYMQILTIRC